MTGSALIEVDTDGPSSFVASLRSSNPLRLLAPISRGPSVWAFTSTFGGGLVGGDETRLDITLAPSARAFIGTQAATKVYRNPDRLPCSHATRATCGDGSLLVYAPDPVQPFAQARYRQTQEFHLSGTGGLVLVDTITAGRAARGERWDFDLFESRNEIFVDGRRRFLDILALRPDDGPLRGDFRLGRFNGLAFVLLLGPLLRDAAAAVLDEVSAQPVPRRSHTLVSASPLAGGGAILRVATEHNEAALHLVRHHLRHLPPLLGDDPWARKW